MSAKTDLLIIANTPSANTELLAAAVTEGATVAAEGIQVRRIPPLEATAEDVLSAKMILLGTTENFGYMSGQIKDFFERIYYPCLEKTEGKPWLFYVRAGRDGAGTLRAVQSITTGLRWRLVQPPLLLKGEHQEKFIEECKTLGETAAAGLSAGIF